MVFLASADQNAKSGRHCEFSPQENGAQCDDDNNPEDRHATLAMTVRNDQSVIANGMKCSEAICHW